jgi:argininosuccinate synthase
LSRGAFDRPAPPVRLTLGFRNGEPVSLDGKAMDPVRLVEDLEALGARYGVGRGVHLGDTILGLKGRVAFEAPAAHLLVLAHRELEKLVLTARQQRLKEIVALSYGDWVHEGQFLDPACRDAEALLLSSQESVTGEVKLLLRPGAAFVEGVSSPRSLKAASKAVYGEAAGEWTPEDARGFSRVLALPSMLAARAKEREAARSAAAESTR